LYFVLLVVFLVLIVGPIVAGKYIKLDIGNSLPMEIMQPTGYSNNDTTNTPTGRCVDNRPCPIWNSAADATGGGGGGAATTDDAARRFRRYMAY
jgi:1,3-beta-glucan synthase